MYTIKCIRYCLLLFDLDDLEADADLENGMLRALKMTEIGPRIPKILPMYQILIKSHKFL